jgi:phospholipid/cholesterol/gamma-HCH transport system substrate-binding protein
METKANTALIGAFTLVVLALGFVFIYWLARGGEQATNVPLDVVFQDPVTGLTVGSQVVFNGINVGTVKTLDLDPDNPKIVIAGLRVRPLRSIKADTQVTLGFQGLTGVGYIEMVGGTAKLPPIWEAQEKPRIVAVRSSFQDLMAGARTILARADDALKTVQTLVADNRDDINQAVKDVRSFTGALAQNSDKVADLIEQVGAASAGIADASKRLQDIATQSQELVAAIDPEKVRSTIDNVASATKDLSAQTGKLDSIVQRADAIAGDVQRFSEGLPALREKADALISAVDPAKVSTTLDRIDAIAAAVDPSKVASTLDKVDSVVAAVDPQQVRTTLADVAKTADAIAAQSDEIGAIADNVRDFSQRLPALGDRADALLAAVDPQKVSGTLDRIDKVASAVDPEQVKTTVANIAKTADAVGAHSAEIGAIVGRANAISDNLESFSQHLPAIGDKADALATAIDPTKIGSSIDRIDAITAAVDPAAVRATVDNVAKTADVVGAHSDEIASIVGQANTIAGNLNSFSQHLPAIGDKADALATAIDPRKIGSSIDRIDAIAGAVDPEQVRTAVAGASSLGGTLQDNQENIDNIVTKLTSLSNDASAFAARLPGLGDKADGLLAAVDPQKVNKTVDNVTAFSTTLADNRANVDEIIANARDVSSRFNALATRADSVLAKLDKMAGEGSGGILEEAKQTLAAVRDAANTFNSQVSTVGGGLDNFSNRGLRDFQNLISQGQRTVSRLDRVISQLEQNPGGFILGGGNRVPEYSGQRH